MVGCDYGIDFEVVHTDGFITSKYFSQVGHKVEGKVSKANWKQIVFNFVNIVQEFYQISPSKEPDEYEESGYIAFWKELNHRRNA